MAVHSLSINLNAKRERGLAFVVARINAERAAENPPRAAVTGDQYLDNLILTSADSWADQEADADRDSLREAFRTASPAQRAGVRTALGLS